MPLKMKNMESCTHGYLSDSSHQRNGLCCGVDFEGDRLVIKSIGTTIIVIEFLIMSGLFITVCK